MSFETRLKLSFQDGFMHPCFHIFSPAIVSVFEQIFSTPPNNLFQLFRLPNYNSLLLENKHFKEINLTANFVDSTCIKEGGGGGGRQGFMDRGFWTKLVMDYGFLTSSPLDCGFEMVSG